MNDFEKVLNQLNIAYKKDEPMSIHTTFKIGGPADYFIEITEQEKLVELIKLCIKSKTKFTILGWGSNVLVSDDGIRGVVIRNRTSEIEVMDKDSHRSISIEKQKEDLDIRHVTSDAIKRGLYEFEDLDYDESNKPVAKLRLESGVNLPKAITWTITNGYTGLQWYSGIPGTIGGAIFNNIHGGTHLFEELIESVTVLDLKSGEKKTLTREEMMFKYDTSIIHKTNDVVLDAVLNLRMGDKDRALFTAKEWYTRKSVQPRNTPGCVWKNITIEQQKELDFESNATGYIIDQKLGWRGSKKIGGAYISDKHANFIENTGDATAIDVLKLIKLTKEEVKKRFNIDLHSEIVFLGFKSRDLDEILEDIE